MFTRMAIYALFAVLMRTASAHIDEVWACVTKFGSMGSGREMAIIERDQLTVGGRSFRMFDDDKDHVLAGSVVSREKGDVVTDYVVLDRTSGRITVVRR